MTSGPQMMMLLMLLVLPLSALLARRIPLSSMAKLFAVWGLIFAGATALILLWRGSGLGE